MTYSKPNAAPDSSSQIVGVGVGVAVAVTVAVAVIGRSSKGKSRIHLLRQPPAGSIIHRHLLL